MRIIGHIDKFSDAVVFSDYIYAQGIANDVEGDDVEGADIWVHDEDLLEKSATALDSFLLNPADPKYQAASKTAEDIRHREKQDKKKSQKKIHGRDSIMHTSVFGVAPVTFVLIAISVGVTLLGGLGSGSKLTQWLSITSYEVVGEMLQWNSTLPEIQQGQVWRLVTPIFIHASLMARFGLLHLLFNMMWLKDLGKMLENAQNGRAMLWKVLVLAVLSNLGQYFMSGPSFGGMSGVVFGLLGYCWVRGKFDLTSGMYVPNQTASFMIVWFFLCLFGVIPGVANVAHAVGLLTGVAWGYLSAWRVNAGS